jgi:Tfp pilus assembly pilus retraction ATPase PilT
MGKGDGMQTLEMNLSWLLTEGLVSRDDAVARSLHPNEIGSLTSRTGTGGRG